MNANALLRTACGLAAALLQTHAQPVLTGPADRVSLWGDRVTLGVSATGMPPLSYQWYFTNAPLPGRTAASLVLTNVTFADAGAYFAVVSDAGGSVTSRVATLTVPAPARLDDRIGANIRLGEDPAQLPPDRRAQAEPHVARDYYDPKVLIATFQEGRFENGAAAAGGYALSRDGGVTWTRALIPLFTKIDGGEYFRAGDSVAAVDLKGNLYLSHLVFRNASPPPNATVISKSTDGGLSFSPPKLVFAFDTETDKTWLTINTFPRSPTANRLVVMANVFGDGKDRLRSSFSDDEGETWSTPIELAPTQGMYCQTFFLPDGSLGVVYFHYLTNVGEPTGRAQIEYIHSPDGGLTFNEPVVVADMTGRMHDEPIARDAWDLPMACTDRLAGVIYVTYQAQSGPAGSRVPQIMFTRSIDQGRTWSPAVAVNDTPDRRGVFNPCIAASPDGQHITIAFYDKRHSTPATGGNLTDYYLAESFDGGESWGPNLRLSEVSSDLRKAPLTGFGRMFADYQGIVPALDFDTPGVAVWIDTRSGNPDPYIARIQRTMGTTFETWRKLRWSTLDRSNDSAADPDQDGIPNLMEYALGLEPTRPDGSPLRLLRAGPIGDGYGGVTVEFVRMRSASDIEWSWQVTRNLVDWFAALPFDTSSGSAPGREFANERVQLSVAIESRPPGGFARMGVRLLPR